MPLTTRRAARALASAVLAAGLAAASALPAIAAGPDGQDASVRPTSSGITLGTGPVSVSVVAPLTLPPSTSGLVSADDLARYTGPFGALTRQLDAVAGTPAAIALDPMILASIRVLGSAAPESATQWLARLEALSNETFLLAYADADVAAAARTETLGDLEPSGFGFALDEAAFSPAETPAPTPTPTSTTPAEPADPDAAPPFPTTDDILAWSSTLPRIAWPSADVGAEDLAALAAAGYEDVIVPSSRVSGPDAPLVAFDGIRGIVADDELSALLADATSAASPELRADALGSLDARFAAESAAHPGRGIVLTLERAWPYAQPGLPETLALLASTTSASFVALSDILETTPTPARLAAGADTEERDSVFASLTDDAAAERAFATVLDDPAELLDSRRLDRIALYSLSWTDDASGWSDAVEAFRARSAEILDSVKLEQGSDVALLAHNANVKVAVSNALPFPVTVRVSIDPRSPILRAMESKLLTVEPESTSTALMPVEAVANGEVVVLTSITSQTGVPIDEGHASIAVHAEWEGIGTLAVVIVLALIVVAGVLRIVITRRAQRRRVREEQGG